MASRTEKSQQNILVAVRVRPLSAKEVQQHAHSIIKCEGNQLHIKDKTYTFDSVFTPKSSQIDVYMKVVAPMIDDVLKGYSCTVFAYGTTGAGKTYTMSGDETHLELNWKTDISAGCIPRAALNIFDKIKSPTNNIEYSVKVSYLELYNEELRDLLNETPSLPLTIYNDPQSKGSVCIMGLKEIAVHNKSDIHELLAKGMSRKRMASTGLNSNSSRSHTVFTITVYSRQPGPSEEDILRMGKLNLVDLAGSESVTRAGTANRIQEIGNINKSLLTLGRVIQGLVEKKSSYIPYRDSKLTRILQDSLGGKTKTSIIATVSPASNSAEETFKTLDYAFRARDITNSPQVNESTTKGKVFKMLTDQIERCRRALMALNNQTGVVLDAESYNVLIGDVQGTKDELLTKQQCIVMLNDRIKELMLIIDQKAKQWEQLKEDFSDRSQLLNEIKTKHEDKSKILEKEKKVTDRMKEHSSELSRAARTLMKENEQFRTDQKTLVNKLSKVRAVSGINETAAENSSAELSQITKNFGKDTKEFLKKNTESLKQITDQINVSEITINDNRLSYESSVVNLLDKNREYTTNYSLETTVNKIRSEHLLNFETYKTKLTSSINRSKMKQKDFRLSYIDLENCCEENSKTWKPYFRDTHSSLDETLKKISDVKNKVSVFLREQNNLREKLIRAMDRVCSKSDCAINNLTECAEDVANAKTYVKQSEDVIQSTHEENVQTIKQLTQSLDYKLPNKEVQSCFNKTLSDLDTLHQDYLQHLDLINKTASKIESLIIESNNLEHLRQNMEKTNEQLQKINIDKLLDLYSSKYENYDAYGDSIKGLLKETQNQIKERLSCIKAAKPAGDTPAHLVRRSLNSLEPVPKKILAKYFEDDESDGSDDKENKVLN